MIYSVSIVVLTRRCQIEFRKLKLPQDLDELADVTLASFQYPENPEWSVQEEEIQEINDTINAIRRFWPLIRVVMVFSPAVRHLLRGVVCEDEGRMIGTLMYQRRRGDEGVYYISNVAVHPDYRRRGIGRMLVETTLEQMRAEKASKVMLDVIAGNLPAYRLYEKLGWKHFSGDVHLVMEGEPAQALPQPAGLEIVEISMSDWRMDLEFAQRVIPQAVQQYDPLEKARFHEGLVMRFLESLTGVRRGKIALRTTADGRVIAMCGYRCRTRPGGSNHARVVVDPVFSPAAPYFVDYITRWVQGQAPGRKIELVTPSWQRDVVTCAQDLGYDLRYEYHSMGLFLEEIQ